MAAVMSGFLMATLGVLPQPQRMSTQEKQAILSSSFQFRATGINSALLQGAFRRYAAILSATMDDRDGTSQADMRSLEWLRSSGVVGDDEFSTLISRVAHKNKGKNPPPRSAAAFVLAGCSVNVKSNASVKTLSTDESYSLGVLSNFNTGCTIEAPTVYGAMYALETFVQLVDSHGLINATTVHDEPRFAFRGTMIDTARHYYPLPAIKQHLDAMAMVKMNVLHWHVVDSQSFPFVSPSLPTMAASGAWSPTHVYTVDDIREVVVYAGARGIRVMYAPREPAASSFSRPGKISRVRACAAARTHV